LKVLKTWNVPAALAEGFAANEYVAACYNIRCSVNGEQTRYRLAAWDTNENGVYDEGDKVFFDAGTGYFCVCGGYHPVKLTGDMPMEHNGFLVEKNTGNAVPGFIWEGEVIDPGSIEGGYIQDFHVTNLDRAEDFIVPADNPNFS
jgi:hypothetical protein